MLLAQHSSNQLVDFTRLPKLLPMFRIPRFLSEPFGISASNKRQRCRHRTAQDW